MISTKTISTVIVEMVLLVVLGYPKPTSLRAPIILAAFVWILLKRGLKIHFKSIYLTHLFWACGVMTIVLLSRYWALVPQGIDDVKNNVFWCTAVTLVMADYVIYYDIKAEEITTLLIPVVFMLFIDTILFGTRNHQNRLSINYNDNAYGMICVGILNYFFYSFIVNKRKKFYVVICIALSIMTLLSGSRKALIGMLIFLIGVIQFREPNQNSKKSFIRILTLIAAVVFAYVMIMNVDALYSTIGNRVDAIVGYLFRNEAADGSLNTRLNMLSLARNFIISHPWLGIGANNFKYNTYYNTYSHNGYTEILCSFGLLGAAVYYIPVLGMTIHSFKNWRAKQTDAIFPLCVFVSFFVCEIGAVSYFSLYNYCFMGLAAGFCYCMLREQMREENRY